MSYKEFKEEVLAVPGARERVAELEARWHAAYGLRDARKRAKISQKELARRLGISQPRIAAIERADDLNLGTLLRYATAIDENARIEVCIGEQRFVIGADAAPGDDQRPSATSTASSQGSARRSRGIAPRPPSAQQSATGNRQPPTA